MDGCFSVIGFFGHVAPAGKDRLEHGPVPGIVINNKDGCTHQGLLRVLGKERVKVVPRPGREATSTDPPWDSIIL